MNAPLRAHQKDDSQLSRPHSSHPKFHRQFARFWWGWAFAFVVTGLLVFLAILPPFVGASARSVIMSGFSTVCHQLPGRSFQINGVSLAVCHRCLGIYIGLFLAVPALLAMYRWDEWMQRHIGQILVASVIPLALDWSGDVFGFWTNTPHSRLITGSLFGIVAGYFVARGVISAFLDRRTVVPDLVSIDSSSDSDCDMNDS